MFKQISLTLFMGLLTLNAFSERVAIFANGPRAKEITKNNHKIVVEVEDADPTVLEVKKALAQQLDVPPSKIQILTHTDGILSNEKTVNILQQQYLFKLLP